MTLCGTSLYYSTMIVASSSTTLACTLPISSSTYCEGDWKEEMTHTLLAAALTHLSSCAGAQCYQQMISMMQLPILL